MEPGEALTTAAQIAVALATCLLTGCAAGHYANTSPGKFYGTPLIEWKNDQEFVFHQNPNKPFYFERLNKEKIIPQTMYTDGGSIPRVLWSFRGYSPWEYGPAFIIHDWLFVEHECKIADWQKYNFPQSAEIMSECLKTLMETQPRIVEKNPTRLYRMYLAVRSFVAKRLWENGKCIPAPPEVASEQRSQSQEELKRRAPTSAPMKLQPKRQPPQSGAPLHEKVLHSIIQSVPVP